MEEKVKELEGDMKAMQSTSQSVDNFTFLVGTSQALHAHTSQNEWVVDSSCTHHMVRDASMFSSLGKATEHNI